MSSGASSGGVVGGAAAAGGQTVDLASLSAQQLSQVKKQLDDEIEHLQGSFTKLRLAQNKFRDCIKSVKDGVKKENANQTILVPLTTSLYVPGKLTDSDKVLVDVGTGFYVEKSTKDAVIFYTAKVEELDKNLKDLDAILQGKSNNLRVIEEVLRQKVLASNGNSAS